MARKPRSRKAAGRDGRGRPARASRRGAREDPGRVDRLVAVQKRSIRRFAVFLTDLSTLATQGTYRPADWMTLYTKMVKELAEDVGDFTQALFSD